MLLQLRRTFIFIVVIGILTLAQSLSFRVRGESADFRSLVDEGSHFTTALMIRDYVVQAFPHDPIAFAKAYYLHYPKVAFGAWPPLFHIALGLWMVIAPATRVSAIVYVEALTAALVVLTYVMARRSLPPMLATAVAAAVWFAAIPQFLTRVVQADTQYALLSALAVYLFADYVSRPSAAASLWVALTFLAALMTKNNALFLGIGFGLILLLTRRFSVLRRADFYFAVVPGVIAMSIWQWFTLPFVRNNMKGATAESTPGLTLFAYGEKLLRLTWPGLIPFALLGIWLLIVRPLLKKERVGETHSASFALLVGPALFHAMLPHDVNQRYLLPSLPPLLIFAAKGLELTLAGRWASRLSPSLRRAVASAAITASIFTVTVRPAPASGYARVAEQLVGSTVPGTAPSILIVASFGGEEMLIPEVMIREARPTHWLLRGIKLLRRQVGVLNRQTALVDTDPQEMLAYLQQLPVELVVLADDGDRESSAQRDYVRTMMRFHPDLFALVLQEPIGAACNKGSCLIEVFRLKGTREGPFAPVKLPADMPLWKGL